MTNQNFIDNIVKLYSEARYSKFPEGKIHRGRSHSISSSTEDLFAKYLVGKVSVDKIFVDQPITIREIKKTIYPDVTLEYKAEIIAFFDIKMDLGWNRDGLYDLCLNQYNLLNKIRGKNCKIRDGITKEDSEHVISNNISMNIVLISDQNINNKKLSTQIEKIKRLAPAVDVFVLTSGVHPNEYRKNNKTMEIKNEEFDLLVNKVKCMMNIK